MGFKGMYSRPDSTQCFLNDQDGVRENMFIYLVMIIIGSAKGRVHHSVEN